MAETVTMPKMGFDMAEGTLVRWVKTRGEEVNKGEILAEIETDKATVEVESPYSGIVLKHLVDQGTVVPVGSPIAIIAAPGEKVEEQQTASTVAKETAPAAEPAKLPAAAQRVSPAQAPEAMPMDATTPEGQVMASPLAKRMAREEGLDLGRIKGSGPEGRVVRKDIEAFVASMGAVTAPEFIPVAPAPVVSPVVPVAAPAADQALPVDRLRAAIGRRMTESKQQIPHIYLTRQYKMDTLVQLRKQFNSYLPDDQKLTVNDFVVKAAALALRQFPNLNSSFAGSQIIRHGQINIGVAVAVEGGLMTVVCRNADQKPLSIISAEVREKAARARTRKVHPEDIAGSTFSISNLGMYHIEEFGAIINPPEVAILAVGVAQQEAVVENGELHVGTRMKVTLSSDHRVTDGAESAEFLEALAQYLEEPLRLVI
jgi:pyruvate dehydrogenase E2 component (dihydrolipoamide acetyltransferase)